jgi:hypothetical protein
MELQQSCGICCVYNNSMFQCEEGEKGDLKRKVKELFEDVTTRYS